MTKVSFLPGLDRILVKADEAAEKSEGGVLLPKTENDKVKTGTVIAAGTPNNEKAITIKKDDKVIFSVYGPIEITLNTEKYLVMRYDEVLGKIQTKA